MTHATGIREIAILAYPGVQSLDVAGPLEVFAAAGQVAAANGHSGRGYRVRVVSGDGKPVECSSGLQIGAHAGIADVDGGIDTLIVAGGLAWTEALGDRGLIDWISTTTTRCRRVTSVCTGKIATAAGVSAGIDMALALAAKIAGDEVAQAIQLGIEYHPQPPFDAGSARSAPPETVELVRAYAGSSVRA